MSFLKPAKSIESPNPFSGQATNVGGSSVTLAACERPMDSADMKAQRHKAHRTNTLMVSARLSWLVMGSSLIRHCPSCTASVGHELVRRKRITIYGIDRPH